MYRILLIIFLSFLFACTNHNSFRQISFDKKYHSTTKRLPFIGSACAPRHFFPHDYFKHLSMIKIWEDGAYRTTNLSKEPFDIIEDLRIYQSYDYLWMLFFVPFFEKYDCDQYHITGYLVYFDHPSKQKLYSKLQKETVKQQPDLPIMISREYSLNDVDSISKKKEEEMQTYREKTIPDSGEQADKKKSASYSYRQDSVPQIQVWNKKLKPEITAMPDAMLVDSCLEFPYECATDPNYIGEIRLRTKADQKQNSNPDGFSKIFLSKVQSKIDTTYFGCYCRKEPDLSIYENCPIDSYGLDSVCKSKYDCLEKSSELDTTNGLNKNQCTKKFKEDLFILSQSKEPKDKIHQGKENFERMIYYTKKLWALEILKNESP
ncbi:hypothetical protein EHQ30_01885 [Leptospira brenneri]|uniref:Lipoprotein n=1 Tax=Leptospira brenneri TaxID=2023182 RepID=A0A5F1Z9E8_9LEPT|nr:hypothetical protein [Leptospira brenneri]TGK95413.1 hypothetical protein EHQ30_01885 [Leptospira brenneri]